MKKFSLRNPGRYIRRNFGLKTLYKIIVSEESWFGEYHIKIEKPKQRAFFMRHFIIFGNRIQYEGARDLRRELQCFRRVLIRVFEKVFPFGKYTVTFLQTFRADNFRILHHWITTAFFVQIIKNLIGRCCKCVNRNGVAFMKPKNNRSLKLATCGV